MSKDERIKTHVGTEDAYKFYIAREDSLTLTQKQYSDILKEFHDAVTNLIIYRNFTFVMPYFGTLSIKKRKLEPQIDENGTLIKKMPCDYKATNELWARDEDARKKKKLVYHLNEDTDNYIFRWTWDKSMVKVRNKTIYTLEMSRTNKRKIKKALRDTDNRIDFFEKKYK